MSPAEQPYVVVSHMPLSIYMHFGGYFIMIIASAQPSNTTAMVHVATYNLFTAKRIVLHVTVHQHTITLLLSYSSDTTYSYAC